MTNVVHVLSRCTKVRVIDMNVVVQGVLVLSVVGKVFGKILIKRIREKTDCVIGEEPNTLPDRKRMRGPSVCSKASV